MPRTTIRSEDITDLEVKTADVAVGGITTAKMATDPTNASNLTSGSVPVAALGNVDTSPLEDDIAILGFKVAANGSLAKYNLDDQTVDAFEDASGVDASASTGESRDSANFYSGVAAASGGTITSYGSYTVHTFLASGNFVANSAGTADILVVAGGGSGGTNGGGGGAGGFRTVAATAVTGATHAVVVGAGGTGLAYPGTGNPGGNSSFGSILTSSGGGGGGGAPLQGKVGGSGGGGGYNSTGGAGNSGSYTPVEGYPGSNDVSGNGQNYGGGGGAGEPGGTNNSTLGYGGDGLENLYRTGSNVFYAGGGGGGRQASSAGTGVGGSGGGGAGTTGPEFDSGTATSGTANTGGGGGGAGGGSATAGSGGSGIVVIRYTGSMGVYTKYVTGFHRNNS